VIVLEAGNDLGAFTAGLEKLAEHCVVGTRVVVLGRSNDVMLFRTLLRYGVSDYVPTLDNARPIVEAIARLLEDPNLAKLGRVIASIGAGGGAGSSIVAHNVAWCLAETFADDVALIDLDFAFGSADLDFNEEAPQSVAAAIEQRDRIDDQLLEQFYARRGDHLCLFTAPAGLDTDADLDPAAFDGLMNVIRRAMPFVVIDLPNRWAGWTRHILKSADEIIVTARPTLASLRNTKSLGEVLNAGRVADAPVRLVLNGIGGYGKSEIPAKDFEAAVAMKNAVRIGYDTSLFGDAGTKGQVVAEASKNHKISAQFRALAIAVSGRQVLEKAASRNTLGFMRLFKRG